MSIISRKKRVRKVGLLRFTHEIEKILERPGAVLVVWVTLNYDIPVGILYEGQGGVHWRSSTMADPLLLPSAEEAFHTLARFMDEMDYLCESHSVDGPFLDGNLLDSPDAKFAPQNKGLIAELRARVSERLL